MILRSVIMNFSRTYKCPIDATINLIGGKYKALLLWKLLEDDVCRFNELQRFLSPITSKMLTQQLREMESDGLIIRVVYPVVPPKTEYSLTEFGRSIIPVLDAMNNWGRMYLSSQGNNQQQDN